MRPTLSTLISSAVRDLFATTRLPQVLIRRDPLNVLMRISAGVFDILHGLLERAGAQSSPITATDSFLDAWAEVAGTSASQGVAESLQDYRQRIIAALIATPFSGSEAEIVALATQNRFNYADRAWVVAPEAPNNTRSDVGVAIEGGNVPTVQSAFDAVRPVAMRITVRAATTTSQGVSIKVGPTQTASTAMRGRIDEALTDFYNANHQPGLTILAEKIKGVIVGAGLYDFELVSPGDVTYDADEIPVFDEVTYS